jgi:hypothetical protein
MTKRLIPGHLVVSTWRLHAGHQPATVTDVSIRYIWERSRGAVIP